MKLVAVLSIFRVAAGYLPFRQLAVDIHYFPRFGLHRQQTGRYATGYALGYLVGQYTFTGTGVAEEDTDFILVPKLAEQFFTKWLQQPVPYTIGSIFQYKCFLFHQA